MVIDPFLLLAAAAGGFFGAAIGALQSFVFCAVTVLLGVAALPGDSAGTFLNFLAFGPIFGPHIGFAGGIAAVAYAHRRGLINGRDIVTPLIKLGKPDVLLVGAVVGMLGYVVKAALTAVPWLGTHTDTIALTVVILGVSGRFAFGRTGLIGQLGPERGWARFAPDTEHQWIPYQEKLYPNAVLGFFAGALSGGVGLAIVTSYPDAGAVAQTVGFAISGVSLLFLGLGMAVPVTHHMTIIGGLAAVTFLPIVNGNLSVALLVSGVFGLLAALVAEFFSRFWHIRGDTHIDPPASAIWLMTIAVLGVGSVLA